MISLRIILELIVSFFIADFLSGLIHWFEDAYFTREMHPWLVENVTKPNRLHHIYPRKTAHSSAWISFAQIIVPGLIVCSPFLIPALHLQPMYFFVIGFGITSNFVHKWNHQKPRERPPAFRIFQTLRIFQSSKAHAVHHTGQTDAGYCTLTDFLNPWLDKTKSFRKLENFIYLVTGIQANGPDEPHKYYKLENGRVLEFNPHLLNWNVWNHKEIFDRPVVRKIL